MTLGYTIEKKDFVALMAYESINNQRFNPTIATGIIFVFFALVSLINGESFIAVSCVVSVLLIILGFNHFYSKGKFSSRINSKIESTKSALFNEKIKLTFETDDSIVVETKFGVSKFNSLAFSELLEIENYIFLRFKTGEYTILPKEKINDFQLNAFIDKIKNKVDLPHKIDLKRTLSY